MTQTEVQHHDALTREIATDPASLTTQSRQSAARLSVSATSAAVTGVRGAAVDIPLVAGASLSSGSSTGSTGSSRTAGAARDTWWADRAAGGGWYSSGPAYGTTSPSFASASSAGSVVSDAPLGATVTTGGSAPSSGGNDLLGGLTLLTGLAAAGAAAHQLGRSGGTGRGSSVQFSTSGSNAGSSNGTALSANRGSAPSARAFAGLARRSERQDRADGADPRDTPVLSPPSIPEPSLTAHELSSPAGVPLGLLRSAYEGRGIVFHATDNPSKASSVRANGFDAQKIFKPESRPRTRFGTGVYVAEDRSTAIKEIESHGKTAKAVLTLRLDEKARIADFTRPSVAIQYGYDGAADYPETQQARHAAQRGGSEVIKYEARAGIVSTKEAGGRLGSNYAILTDPTRLLTPIADAPLNDVAVRGARMASVGGKVLLPLGVAADGWRLKSSFDEDGGQIGRNTITTAGSVAGGWAGAAYGAAQGAAVGAIVGTAVPVVGTLVGAIVGGLAGGILGGLAGSHIGERGGAVVAAVAFPDPAQSVTAAPSFQRTSSVEDPSSPEYMENLFQGSLGPLLEYSWTLDEAGRRF